MLHILLATARPEAFHSFCELLLSAPEVSLDHAMSGTEALIAVRKASPHLVVIDSELPDFDAFDLVRELLVADAMIGTAVVSPLSEEEFHEASEGLGVLARLPVEPRGADAAELLDKLRRVLGVAV